MWTDLTNLLCWLFLAPSTSFSLNLLSTGIHSEDFSNHPQADGSLSTAGVCSAHLSALCSSLLSLYSNIWYSWIDHFLLETLSDWLLCHYTPMFSSTLYHLLIFPRQELSVPGLWYHSYDNSFNATSNPNASGAPDLYVLSPTWHFSLALKIKKVQRRGFSSYFIFNSLLWKFSNI